MKIILTFCLMLILMMTSAQETPKLLEVNCKPAGEDTTFLKYEFEYDENGLEAVTLTNAMTSEWYINFYELDTLMSKLTNIGMIFYQHKISENKIVETIGSTFITYNVNPDYEITDYWTNWDVWYAYDYEWLSNNLQSIYRNDSLMLLCEYSVDYRNPFYGMNKTFKVNPWSSYDFPISIWDDINDTNLINIEFKGQIDGYPTEIDYFDDLDNLLFTEYFVYDETTGIDSKLPPEPYEVLSVHYYDIIGRKINKPTNGFYIESKITSKGIVNKKYYVK